MTRRINAILVLLVLAGSLALGGCARTVRVETGELVTCTYGEVVTDTVKVVEVPADKAASYHVVKKTVTCDRHKHLEDLYAQAQAAILAADLDAAKAKLAEIVKQDAAFKRAQAQLDAIQAGKAPVPDNGASTGGANTGTGGTGDKQPVGPIANLSDRLPDSLPGYTAAPISSDVFNLSRQYTPSDGSPTDSLVVVVEQYKDATAAKKAISAEVTSGYREDVSTAKVAGRTVRFGTDGRRFATLVWNEGGVLIAIEASSASRKPENLKSHLVSLAAEIVK